jgi:DNA-binding PadR family transcriptional regulator
VEVRRPANPLALAVLALLYEKAMHPYEISSTLRERHKEDSIKINYGSLYAVVESMEKRGLIGARERVRDGRRPERTVYALTPSGEKALHQWLGELLAEPSRQFTDFEAALSLMPAVPPERAAQLLRQRLDRLREEDAAYQRLREMGANFPRIFMIEGEFQAALRATELRFVTELLAEIERGSFDGMALWRRFHELKAAGAGDTLLSMLEAEFRDQLTPPTQE